MTGDWERAPRLLLTEAAALLPILRAAPGKVFDRPTLLPGWSLRDVLAHCSAALGAAATGQLTGFTPEDDQRGVDERRDWQLPALLDELEGGYRGAAEAIGAAAGALDGLALGEWVHGGDVRDALGHPDAYASAGLDDALALLVERAAARAVPRTRVTLTAAPGLAAAGSDGPGSAAADSTSRTGPTDLELGAADGPVQGELVTDAGTLIRLCAGRRPDPQRYRLHGTTAADYLLFR